MNSSISIPRWLLGGAAPALLAILAFLLGAYLFGAEEPTGPSAGSSNAETSHESQTTWTCSMHPQVQLPKMGKCPICFMDLIPLVTSSSGAGQVALQPDVVNLLSIETRPATRQAITHAVSMVGKLAIDETRTSIISAWVPGRIDRLFVDSTGISVRKNDHLADLYSPPLYQAQVELAQARSALARARAGHSGRVDESLVSAAQSGVTAVEERMRLWGLTEAQIHELAVLEKPTDQITIFAPSKGVVTEKLVHEGHYVETGTPIYSIADLSGLWLELQAFESDLPWLSLGQEVHFQTDSLPGETFEGKITFIEPWIDPGTRTAKLRVEVPNEHGRLKPEMFVRAKVQAEVSASGTALSANLDGTYSCPMHPNVSSPSAGDCPICGMPLEPWSSLAGSFGASHRDNVEGLPLVIPTTAPLITGRRAVVYVQTDGEDGELIYQGREIELGPRAGGMFVVLDGLEEGELVVTRGSFKIDSELELKAQTSWMSSGVWEDADGDVDETIEPRFEGLSGPFRKHLNQLWTTYLGIQGALAGDDPGALNEAMAAARLALAASFRMDDLDPEALAAWKRDHLRMGASLERLSEAGLAMAEQRARFETFSGAVDMAMQHFGSAIDGPVYRVHCPMAFDNRGADWLQRDETVNNPYFGAAMLRCGDVTETLWTGEQAAEQEAASGHKHAEQPSSNPGGGEPKTDLPLEPAPALPPVEQPTPQPVVEPTTQPVEVEQEPEPAPQPPSFGTQLDAVWSSYLAIQESLAADDLVAMRVAIGSAGQALEVDFNLAKLTIKQQAQWPLDSAALGTSLVGLEQAALTIAKSRTQFELLSRAMLQTVLDFQTELSGPVYRVHCPMAFGNKGADWLQADKRVNNPYFGASMLRCGSVKQTLIEGEVPK
ncbi:MAG: Cu(I)/Ag(I) efflux system membrane fusion protein [Gammaproteobacteria bacterium]|jgi:Cu(I)/Ag(I) efflux system membrane fusion protein